jgi:hypothetical protein
MGIATKYRRKININGRIFIWYVRENLEDIGRLSLNVVSADKHFIVTYRLDQTDDVRHLEIKGKEFPGLLDAGHCWKRILCPQWETNSIITPNSVRALIDWCLNSDRPLILVDWEGNRIPE